MIFCTLISYNLTASAIKQLPSVEITSGYETKGYLGSNERSTKIRSYENYIGVHKDHVKIYKNGIKKR